MKKQHNPGVVNINEATNGILSNGGGMSQRPNSDGSTHISVYSTTENRHLSYDKDKDGNISGVHTDKDGHANMNYKGGR